MHTHVRTTIRLGAAYSEERVTSGKFLGLTAPLYLRKAGYDRATQTHGFVVDEREASLYAKALCRRHGIVSRGRSKFDMRSHMLPEEM